MHHPSFGQKKALTYIHGSSILILSNKKRRNTMKTLYSEEYIKKLQGQIDFIKAKATEDTTELDKVMYTQHCKDLEYLTKRMAYE